LGRSKIYNQVQNQKQAPAIYEDVLASRPAAGFVGRLFVSTDTFALYRDNGSTYDLIGGPGTGTITGSGTTGNLVKFTAPTIIGDSIVTESGAAIIVAGSVTGTSIIKTGGTSVQFLKADGSIDSNTYLTAAGAVTSITGTANQVIASASVGAVILSLPQSIGTSSNVTFGTITGTSIIKTGGTSVQFLKADGSIDSNTYLTAAGAVTSITGTANQVIASASVGAVILSLPQSINIAATPTFAKVLLNNDSASVYVATTQATFNSLLNTQNLTVGAGHNIFISLSNGSNNVGYFGMVENATGFGDFVWNTYTTGAFREQMRLLNSGRLINYTGLSIADGTGNSISFTDPTVTTTYAFIYSDSNVGGRINMSAVNNLLLSTNGTIGFTMTNAQVITTSSRLNVNGAADNALFTLNNNGTFYTAGFSPNATAFSTAQTISTGTTYIFNGGAGITFTMSNPSGNNQLYIVKNWSANTLTIAGYAGGTNIIDTTNTAVASILLLTGKTAILQQDGASRTFVLSIY